MIPKFRLRTKLLFSMVAISVGLTAASLLVVRRVIYQHERERLVQDLRSSVSNLDRFQQQREQLLNRNAELVADLPITRALMTTQHPLTIQDASRELWQLAGSDLFILADASGKIFASDNIGTPIADAALKQQLAGALLQKSSNQWWYLSGRLYETSLQPIYFGSAAESRVLGFLILGVEVNDALVRNFGRTAVSEVAVHYGDHWVRSTLPYSQQSKLQHLSLPSDAAPVDVELAGERFVGTTAQLAPQVQLLVLKSIDQATAFLSELNRILLGLGLIALGAGSIFVFLLSDKFTKPLQDLVAAVRALGRGDYSYPLNPVSGDEIAEVSVNFDRMRESLQASQRRLLEAERLVTIGQMASSISHDLRHQLVAIVANAEYLADPKTGTDARQELYDEIRFAVNQMTDLVESLLEFSRTRESLRPTHADLKEILEHAVKTVRLHPEFQHINIEVNAADNSEGWFDCPKLERVFQNLLRNACAAVDAGGVVTISAQRQKHSFAIRIADNGRGIPQDIQAKIFEPFFSYGKESGTGLGLAVAQKIAQDHGGELRLERSSELGTVFVVRLPAGPPLPSTSNVSHSAVS